MALRRRPSGEIPLLLKAVVCSFFAVVSWLLAQADDVPFGPRVGLSGVAAIAGLSAAVWIIAWLESLAEACLAADTESLAPGATPTTARPSNENGPRSTPLATPADLEIRSGEESEELASPPGPLREDTLGEKLLGGVLDILTVFPYFLCVVMFTPLLVYTVACSVLGWLGAGPQIPTSVAIATLLNVVFAVAFGWRWRTWLLQTELSRLQRVIMLLFAAECAGLGVSAALTFAGWLVHKVGTEAGWW